MEVLIDVFTYLSVKDKQLWSVFKLWPWSELHFLVFGLGEDDISEFFIGFILKRQLQLTLKVEPIDFQNVVLSQPEPYTADKPPQK